jgi:flagellin-like hook-associated protein FlgL
MQLRPTQASMYGLVRRGLTSNTMKLVRAQEQTATGRRILRPSDDAAGTSVAMSLRRQIGSLETFVAATSSARPQVDQAAARLEDASGLMTEARELIIQGMNGSLGDGDREQLATQLELIYGRLLDVANSQSGDRYLFAGTNTNTRPFEVTEIGGERRVVYHGNKDGQRVLIGRETTLEVSANGDDIFARAEYSETIFGDITGIKSGAGGDSGYGYEMLHVRQDGTLGATSEGVQLANLGTDTLIGDRALVVDAAARTVQLGAGVPMAIPVPAPSNMRVVDEHGAEVRLDMSGWTGAGMTTTLTGAASLSLDGIDYTPVTLTETSLQLVNGSTGSVIHVDTTELVRAGHEQTTFAGTPNLFDTLQGIVADLRNGEGVNRNVMIDRVGVRLREFDRSQSDLLLGLGQLGATSKRIQTSEERLLDLRVELQGLVSNVEDADFSLTALDLTRAEQTLQLAQATGSRVIQQSFLNFLR